jgi:HTH-type transcriptional regulator/antitoxin HigA
METRLVYKRIKTEVQYNDYVNRMEELDGLLVENHNAEFEEEIDLLQLLVEDYEQKHIATKVSSPSELLKLLLKEHKLTANDLAKEFEISKSVISEVLSNKRAISKSFAVKIANKFKVRLEHFLC